MSDLWIVIPAAGKSQRFIDAGYSISKPLLNLKAPSGKESWMINHVLDTIPPGYPIITALPTGLKVDTGGLTHMQCIEIVLDEVEASKEKHYIQYIEKTLGQADTVYQTIKHIDPNDSVMIVDVDTILDTKDLQTMIEFLQVYDAVIAVATSFDPNASRVDQIPFPTRFVEKQPISQYAIIGARAFKSIGLLTSALKRVLERYEILGQEPFLSVAINHYPGTKYAHQIMGYTDLGTPQAIVDAGWEILS